MRFLCILHCVAIVRLSAVKIT